MSERPWMTKNGSMKNDDEIKAISKNWSMETWEQFLHETSDTSRTEDELTRAADCELVRDDETLAGFLSEATSEAKQKTAVYREVERIAEELDLYEYKILQMYYGRKLSDAKIGKILNIPGRSINDFRRNIVANILNQLTANRVPNQKKHLEGNLAQILEKTEQFANFASPTH